LIHTFEDTFYGEELRVIILGFIRCDEKFSSLDALIEAIKSDVAIGSVTLDEDQYRSYATDSYLFQ
jgi:FAD synthase